MVCVRGILGGVTVYRVLSPQSSNLTTGCCVYQLHRVLTASCCCQLEHGHRNVINHKRPLEENVAEFCELTRRSTKCMAVYNSNLTPVSEEFLW